MDVKVEEAVKLESSVHGDICQLCLSTERRTYGVESVSYAYGVMTDWAPQRGARVCWECRAALVRLLRLKVQALRARELLDAAAHSLNTAKALSGRCMSQLSVSTTTALSFSDVCSPIASDTECKEEVEAWTVTEPYMVFNVAEVDDVEEDVGVVVLNSHKDRPPERPPPPKKRRSEQPQAKADKTRKKPVAKVDRQKKPKANADAKNRTRVARVKAERKTDRQTDKKMDAAVEMLTATADELNAYRTNVLSTMRPYKYTCTHCVENFSSEHSFKRHIAICHTETCGAFVCDICNCGLASGEKLEQHRSNHFRLFRCLYPGCGFLHHKRATVRVHHRRHVDKLISEGTGSSGPPVNYECDYCGATYALRAQMYRHIKMHQGRYLCENCGKAFICRSSLQTHYLTHASIDARPFPCERCSRKFITKDKLAIHMLYHEGVKPFGCDECDRKFRVKPDLTRHKMLRHSTRQPAQKRKLTRTKSQFRNEKFLVDRTRWHAARAEGGKTDGVSRGDYASVQKPPFQCHVCGKNFNQKSHLASHAVFHTGDRPHKCNECDLTFRYRPGLWAHKLVHKGVKAHQCTVCGAQFTLKGNLNGHMKIHTKDKPYECDICGQRFPWRRNLRNHFKVHSKQ